MTEVRQRVALLKAIALFSGSMANAKRARNALSNMTVRLVPLATGILILILKVEALIDQRVLRARFRRISAGQVRLVKTTSQHAEIG